MKTTMTKWFWWWGWNAETLEIWLEEMAADGWQLISVNCWGIGFVFRRGELKKTRTGVDYQANPEEAYLELFRDDGWELIWSGAGGWYIWQKAYETVRPEIYNDIDSLLQRNKRLVRVLGPLFLLLIGIFALLAFNHQNVPPPLIWLYAFLISLYSFIFFQFGRYTRRLKESIKD